MLTISDFASASPSAQTVELADAIETKAEAFNEVALAILARNVDHLGSGAPMLDKVLDRFARRVYAGKLGGRGTSAFQGYFLPLVALVGLAEGDSDRTVISPSGMMHTRSAGEMKTSCGKPISNHKWVPQFHRGVTVHRLYRFNMGTCSVCLRSYDDRPYHGEPEMKLARQVYAAERAAAIDVAKSALVESLKGEWGKTLLESLPLDDEHLEAVYQVLNKKSSSWVFHREVAQAAFGSHSSMYNVRQALAAKQIEFNLLVRRSLATSLAKRMLAASRHQVALFLLTPSRESSRMPDLNAFAAQAYGSLDFVPLPEIDELVEILANPIEGISDGHQTVEKAIIPALLASTWREKMLPLVEAAAIDGPSAMKDLVKIAHRRLPDRTPPHTNGTHTIDTARLYEAIDEKRQKLGMTWAAVAAEACLAIEKIEALATGTIPDLVTYMSLRKWASLGQDFSVSVTD